MLSEDDFVRLMPVSSGSLVTLRALPGPSRLPLKGSGHGGRPGKPRMLAAWTRFECSIANLLLCSLLVGVTSIAGSFLARAGCKRTSGV